MDLLLVSCSWEVCVAPLGIGVGLHVRFAHHFYLTCWWHSQASFYWDCLFPSHSVPVLAKLSLLMHHHSQLRYCAYASIFSIPQQLGTQGDCLGFLCPCWSSTKPLLSSSPFLSSKFMGSLTYFLTKEIPAREQNASSLSWQACSIFKYESSGIPIFSSPW